MKSIFSMVVALLFAGSSVFAAGVAIDSSHTKVEFTVPHMVISNVTGHFNEFQGSADFDASSNRLKDVKVTIKTASIDTNNAKRDGHLKSPDFFDAGKNPEIVFVSTKTVRLKKGKAVSLPGKLTIRGVTRPVTFKITYNGTIKDPYGKQRSGFSAETMIDRQQYNVKWNQKMEAGGLVVGNKVKLSIEGEVVR